MKHVEELVPLGQELMNCALNDFGLLHVSFND